MGLIFKKSTAQPAFSAAAAITGTAEVGETLTCTYTVVRARTHNIEVRWFAHNANDGSDAGTQIATGVNLPLTGGQFGKYIRAVVAASNPAGAVTSTSDFTAAIINVPAPPNPPAIATAASISGTVEVGSTLTVTYDFNDETSVAIQWVAYDSAGGGTGTNLGTSSTQLLSASEDGKWIGCIVTAYNAVGGTPSAATLVGPVTSDATAAPEILSAAAIALDEAAAGYNEGEYIVCNASFAGNTSTPTFAWYQCDAGKANPELLTGAGEAAIQPLPISQPNNYQGALFLAQSLGLNAAGKYIYCVASATNSEGTTPSESDAIGPIGAILGTGISAATVGDGPYYLPSANTTYYLSEDITVDGTAFIMNKANQKLNLNGKTVTFDNATPIISSNAGFEDGATGWDWTDTGNAGAGVDTIGTTTYADIYTAPDFETGYNLRRITTGLKSLRFKNAALANNGVYSLVKRAVTLETGKSYTISFMASRSGTAGVPYARLRHAVDGSVAVAFWNTTIQRGMQYVEIMYYARHSPAEYTLEVGVLGQTGASGDCYIDDVKVSRTRTAGVFITDNTEYNSLTASHFTITNGGSGYTDGTYNNVLTTYQSGGQPSTAPSANITVSGGVVTAATVPINAGGRFIIPGSTFTVSNSLLGGSGSGLVLTVSGVGHHYGGNISGTTFALGEGPVQVSCLEQTTRSNAAATCLVKNGTITQGQDNGTWPAAVGVTYHNHAMHRLNVTLQGENASAIRNSYAAIGRYATVKDSTFNCNWAVSGHRDYNWGSVLHYVGGHVGRCRFYSYPISAIIPNGASDSNGFQCYGNTFRAKMRWSNGRAAVLGRSGQRFYDNIVDNTGDYYGRCVAVGGGSTFNSGTLWVYNNRISFQPSRLNGEYNGVSGFGDHGLQIEGLYSASTVNVYGNEINAYASGAPTAYSGSGGYILANALTINELRSGSTLNLYGNTINAIASGQGYACVMSIGGAGIGEVYGAINWSQGGGREVWNTNSIYIRGAGTPFAEFVGDVNWTTPVDNEKRPLIAEAEAGTAAYPLAFDFRDCTFGTGALAEIAVAKIWEDPRWGTAAAPSNYGGYFVRWSITFDVGQAAATVTVKRNGVTLTSQEGPNTVDIAGTSDANGFCALKVPQYYMVGSTLTDYNSSGGLTVEATKDALSGSAAFTADAAKTVTVSMS